MERIGGNFLGHLKTGSIRMIVNAYPGCEYIAWGALIGAMRKNPECRRQGVRTPDGHVFIVKWNGKRRLPGWSITQIKEGSDES